MKRFLAILLVFFFTELLPAQVRYTESVDNSKSEVVSRKIPSEIVRVIPVSSFPPKKTGDEGDQKRYLVLVRTDCERKLAFPVIENAVNGECRIFPAKQDLVADNWALFYIEISKHNNGADNSQTVPSTESVRLRMSWQNKDQLITVPKSSLLDLSELDWYTLYQGEKVLPKFTELPANYFGEKPDWQCQAFPRMWETLGVTWIKTSFRIPAKYQGRDFVILMPAIDDNDITYINGHKIGETYGWDTPRRYVIPAKFMKFDGENELLIAEHNQNAGGGIQGTGFWIGPKEEEPEFVTQVPNLFPEDVVVHESNRRTMRPLGTPLPLRPMVVRDGVLEYENGGETVLWGTNYYPQSWGQYYSLRERNVDFYKAVDQDLEDIAPKSLAAPGCDGNDPRRMNIIRIHVFDTEISDSKGNLVRNDHLDILDYLAAQCIEHGLYLWLTPIAWWGSPVARSDAFSKKIPMPAMTLLSETRPIQINYLRQFLTHQNPYTKRRLVDEPCLVLFEIMNETLYWNYSEIMGRSIPYRATETTPSWIGKLRAEWEKSLPDPTWKSPQAWDYFCYRQIRSYIDEVHATIRSLGGKQPIAYHGSNWSSKTPVAWAIADSHCEALTLNYYSGLSQTPIEDKKPHLNELTGFGLPRQVEKKARLVYEFDASDTLFQIDLYPAIARHFRELGVQVACQFQYDSRFTADRNQEWSTHYLNLIHAPHRFASFMIGGETFRTLPRGTKIAANTNELIFPPTAVNWKLNAAFCAKQDLFMQAQFSDWKPFDFPKSPCRIMGTGSTPYYRYDGTGFVDLKLNKKGDDKNDSILGSLSLGPNVIRHRKDLRGTAESPLTTLSNEKKIFILTLPGMENVVYEDSKGNNFNGRDGLSPGEYKIKRGI